MIKSPFGIMPLLIALMLFVSWVHINPNQRVFDYESDLTPTQIEELEQSLLKHEALTTNQIAIVTRVEMDTFSDPKIYATYLANKMGVGQKDQNNGVLIFFSGTQHKAAIAVGLGLEHILTDSICNYVLMDRMIPRFKAQDDFGGFQAGSKELIRILESQ